ncbi:MAG: (2Fe-2S)-binding protein, partial [Gammaproteobacteria bacterium]|nr:(2Fe-2S)-binding protein [Gammaproteobacteria bacterium]
MISLKVNGVERQIDADPDMPLLWAVRDLLKL